MTEIERGPSRARRTAASLLALTLLTAGAAACAQEADNGSITMEPVDDGTSGGGDSTGGGAANFQATTEFLKESATRSESASRRYEMRFAIGDTVSEDAPPVAQGEIDGDQFHSTMDLGPIMEGVASQLGGSAVDLEDIYGTSDLSMEMIGTGDTWYLRAPMLAAMGDLPGTPPGFEDLAVMGDGWGSIDVQQLGELLPGDVAGAVLGQSGVDPSAIIEVVSNAEGVEDLGTSTIRDAQVHGLRAEVTLGAIVEASGQDPDALAGAAGGVGGTVAEEAMQQLYDTVAPVEVWIDDDGYLARMTYGFSMADIFEAIGMDDEAGALGVGDLQFAYSIDMFDYGESFTFEAPADAVDITDAFAQIYQG